MQIITCEQVSIGHPDRLADQIAEAVCADCMRNDPYSRAGIECLIKDKHIVIAGEMTSRHRPDYRKLVDDVFKRIGEEELGYRADDFEIEVYVSEQSPDIALGVDTGGAGDQGVMWGFATSETPELLPIPYMTATRFLQMLGQYPGTMFRADAKAQVSFDYDSGRITTFLCSVQHRENVRVKDFRRTVERLMAAAAAEYGLNTDFAKWVNPTGRFVIGGPSADCGVSGRKLGCDTYGGAARNGCGAIWAKDPTKVDRSGAYITRKIARDIVRAGYAEKCEIQIAYAIGMEDPVGLAIDCFGTETQPMEFLHAFVRENYDLTPEGIIDRLDLRDVDYGAVSPYGHFLNPQMPWEK